MTLKKGILALFTLVIFAAAAFSQTEMNSKGEPVAKNAENAPVNLKAGEKIFRGAPLSRNVKKIT
ncbi:hypothetical protein OFM36_31070, partial [Escherichia coli]|nr:hypothetical protein [Escherichia coli]